MSTARRHTVRVPVFDAGQHDVLRDPAQLCLTLRTYRFFTNNNRCFVVCRFSRRRRVRKVRTQSKGDTDRVAELRSGDSGFVQRQPTVPVIRQTRTSMVLIVN